MVFQKKANSAAASPSTMFWRRALTTITVGPVFLWFIYMGGWYFFIPVTLVVGLATFEYTNLLKRVGWRLPLWILLPAVVLQLVAAEWPSLELFAPAMVVSLLLVMFYALVRYERRLSPLVLAEWASLAMGVLLLGWMSGHFFLLRGLGEMATQWTALVMLSTWLADSAAYVFGSWLGRHKLAPRLSPRKTVEGYVAGILVGSLLTVGVGLILGLPWAHSLLLGILISVIGPVGDLGISLFKREAGVKDSGNILPGHGGALDRIDSLVWSVTISYYVLSYLI